VGSNLAGRALLVAASLAAALGYAAWTANRTVLDPATTNATARAIVTTPAVQASLTNQVAKQVDDVLAERGANPQVRTAVAHALRDPAVTAAFADAVASIDRALLGEGSGKVTVDTRALTISVQRALARENPQLAEQFRANAATRPLTVDIGNDKIPNLGPLHRDAQAVTLIGFALALLLGALALLVWHERPAFARAGRRIAYLAIAPLLVFLVLPLVVSRFSGTAPEVIGTVLRSYRGRVLPSAIAFLVLGLLVAVGSVLVPRRATEDPPVASTAGRDLTVPSPYAPAMTSPSATGDKLYL
jgi:hypothetical protein